MRFPMRSEMASTVSINSYASSCVLWAGFFFSSKTASLSMGIVPTATYTISLKDLNLDWIKLPCFKFEDATVMFCATSIMQSFVSVILERNTEYWEWDRISEMRGGQEQPYPTDISISECSRLRLWPLSYVWCTHDSKSNSNLWHVNEREEGDW